MAEFEIPPALAAVSLPISSLALSDARLMNDTRYPWIVLVPRKAGAIEIEDLSAAERALLMEEAVLAGQAVRDIGEMMGRPVEKLNIAALGNVTAALHLHVTGRRADDFSWPSPCYGLGPASPWAAEAAEAACRLARRRLRSPR
jgi:diadenosine tetraphosphate (Ap4A) HIT family hydrolase